MESSVDAIMSFPHDIENYVHCIRTLCGISVYEMDIELKLKSLFLFNS